MEQRDRQIDSQTETETERKYKQKRKCRIKREWKVRHLRKRRRLY